MEPKVSLLSFAQEAATGRTYEKQDKFSVHIIIPYFHVNILPSAPLSPNFSSGFLVNNKGMFPSQRPCKVFVNL
jgi:hypothetical protein